MKLILDYHDHHGQTRKVWLGMDQILQVGKTRRADVVIDGDPNLADVHFAITGLDGQWRIAAFSERDRLAVNGRPTTYRPLMNGDTILAGQTTFSVSIEGWPADSARAGEKLAGSGQEQVVELVPLLHSTKRHASQVVEFGCKFEVEHFDLVLGQIRGGGRLMIAVNERQGAKFPPGLQSLGVDLLQHAPDEIRETDSLEVLQLTAALPWFESSDFLRAQDDLPLMILSSQWELADLLEKHRLAWGWFSRPSILEQSLTLGSPQFVEMLLGNLEFILFLRSGTPSYVQIFTLPENSERIAQLLSAVRLPK